MQPGPPANAPIKTAIVTGGSGFIGRHLMRSFIDRGFAVINIDVGPVPPPLDSQVLTLRWDIRQPLPDPPPATRAADLVVHLAAVAREPGFPDEAYEQANVAGTAHVLEWCSRNGLDRLWFTSSMSVYGPSESPLYESAELHPRTPYGRSKVAAERLVHEWLAGGSERRALIVRPAVVFGPGERGNFTRLARGLARRRFVYPGRSDTIKASVHVEELIDAMWFLDSAQRERGERALTANVAYPEASTIRDICETFHSVGGLPRPWGTVPLAVMKIAAGVLSRLRPGGDVAPLRIDKLVQSTNIYPGELLRLGYSFQTDLAQGVQRWYGADPSGQFV